MYQIENTYRQSVGYCAQFWYTHLVTSRTDWISIQCLVLARHTHSPYWHLREGARTYMNRHRLLGRFHQKPRDAWSVTMVTKRPSVFGETDVLGVGFIFFRWNRLWANMIVSHAILILFRRKTCSVGEVVVVLHMNAFHLGRVLGYSPRGFGASIFYRW